LARHSLSTRRSFTRGWLAAARICHSTRV
jgi:hypothetical protein